MADHLYRVNGSPATYSFVALRDVCEDAIREGKAQIKIIHRASASSDPIIYSPYCVVESVIQKGRKRVLTRYFD